MTSGCRTAVLPEGNEPASVTEALERRIRARKLATAQGDSTAWLAAASLHPRAVCVDAAAKRRSCRPDFAVPGQWEQRTAIDSLEVQLLDGVAVATYRQTDTIIVAGNTATGQSRYVETYRQQQGEWLLVALSEATVPPARRPVAIGSSSLGRLAGSYGTEQYALRVEVRGQSLLVAARGEPQATLLALGPTRFFADGDQGEYEFVGPESQPAEELRYSLNGQVYRFLRQR